VQALEDQGEEIEAAQASAVASAAASEDLHASLEGHLRASHADVGRLQSEVKRLKAVAEAAAASAVAAASPVGREAFQPGAQIRLEGQLQTSQADVKRLQAEVAHLRSEVSAAGSAASTGMDSPVSRDGSQSASVSGRSAATRPALPKGLLQGAIHSLLHDALKILLAVQSLLSGIDHAGIQAVTCCF